MKKIAIILIILLCTTAAHANCVKLVWNKVPNADNYVLFWYMDGGLVNSFSAGDNACTVIQNLPPGKLITYQLVAYHNYSGTKRKIVQVSNNISGTVPYSPNNFQLACGGLNAVRH